VAPNPDRQLIATSGGDRTIRLWDVVTGLERATLRKHSEPVIAMAFTADGSALVTVTEKLAVLVLEAAPRSTDLVKMWQ
jgi:WD40 repeat protein